MADDKDVLDKADALLRRHSIAAPTDGSKTGGVPVLTDLVETPDGEPPAAEFDAPLEVPAIEPAPAAAPESAPVPEGDLTQEVIDRVLAEVEQRLAVDLERRVIEHLTPQVHAAVVSAMGDLHQELANAIGDAIAQALERRPVK